MKMFLSLGFLLGLGAILAGGYLWPFVDHPRIESRTTVAINGGRRETFLIRLPADRISTVGDPSFALRGRRHPTTVQLPADFEVDNLLLEHFKLRDIEGNVIGLAAHHVTMFSSGPVGVWALSIPGRGTLVFAGAGQRPNSIEGALQTAGYQQGVDWVGDLTIDSIVDPERTRVVTGTDEFSDVAGQYTETWNVTGVSQTGEIRGTIEFRTLVQRRS
jgi:hypothetical protein